MTATHRQLRRIERESGLWFGLRWSFIGCALALLLLSGCSLFDSGAVRYNTVTGERRAPVLNPGGAGYASTDMAKRQMVQHYAPQPMMADPAMVAQPYPPQAAMPQQPMPQQPMAPQAATGADGYPTLPPTADGALPPGQGDAAIAADIDALERDLASSQAQRGQIAAQHQDDGWMPNLGIGEWFGGNSAPSPAAAAPITASSNAQPMQLPIPPAAPGSAPAATAAMDVPLAPGSSSSPMANLPSGLIPPGEDQQGYLGDSRYAGRRGASASRPF